MDIGMVDIGEMDTGKGAKKTVKVVHHSHWPVERKKLNEHVGLNF